MFKISSDVAASVMSSFPRRRSKLCSDAKRGVQTAAQQCGRLSVAGRYTDSRALESDIELKGIVLGRGMSGEVVLGSRIDSGMPCAVKTLRKERLTESEKQSLQNEVEFGLSLDHPHIIKVEQVFENEQSVHIVTEMLQGGELHDSLRKRGCFSEDETATIVTQLLEALSYMHERGIVHCDLKLENVLLEGSDSDQVRIIDFGLAARLDGSTPLSHERGTRQYMAPEVFYHSYNQSADMWSLGVMVFMMLTGASPWQGTSNTEIRDQILDAEPRVTSRYTRLSEDARSFTQGLLNPDVRHRLDAQAALLHPFVVNRERRFVVSI